jgi:DNA modification methylase
MQQMRNSLLYGDNLPIMREKIADESVDLIYLDPPFNSDLNYNVLFKADGLHSDEAQVTAFKDTWTWDAAAQTAFDELQNARNPTLVNFVNALHGCLSRSPMLAYLVNMALRIVEIHRVLKPTGSVYLHCDPTASHYLKMLMDAVFWPTSFRSEIIWRRTGSHNKAKRWAPIHYSGSHVLPIVLEDKDEDRQWWLEPEVYYNQLDYPIYLSDSSQIKFTVEQSENSPVIRLDSNGMVHGLRPGKAKIIASFDGVVDTVVVTVYTTESAPAGYRRVQ